MSSVVDVVEVRARLGQLSRYLLRRLPLTHRGSELWPLVQHLASALTSSRVIILLHDETSQLFREAASSFAHDRTLVVSGDIRKCWRSEFAAARFFKREPLTEPHWLRVLLDREDIAFCLPLRASGRDLGIIFFNCVAFADDREVRDLLDDIGRETAVMLECIHLREVAATDSLTRLPRRHVIDERLTQEIERSSRSGAAVSVIMADLDNFKRINDEFGHGCGDHVLQDVARILQQGARRVDLVGRWGGEEFVLILADTDGDGAYSAADKLRRAIEQHIFVDGNRSFSMTASFGVAQLERGSETESQQLIARADRALYVAKRSGRNQVHVDVVTIPDIMSSSGQPGARSQ